MAKDLANSKIDRQNILNNEYAINEIEKQTSFQGIIFQEQIYFTKAMVATYFDIDIRTIERYISSNLSEFEENGYKIVKGSELKEFILCVEEQNVPDINVGNISNRTPQLSIFNFKSFLNLAMLLVESDNAKVLRQIILDIVIDTINQKTGGSTKYINQRDAAFIGAFLQEENYRKEFTDALRDYVSMGNAKYAIYTNKIYESIFCEKAQEYKKILKLSRKDSERKTMYS